MKKIIFVILLLWLAMCNQALADKGYECYSNVLNSRHRDYSKPLQLPKEVTFIGQYSNIVESGDDGEASGYLFSFFHVNGKVLGEFLRYNSVEPDSGLIKKIEFPEDGEGELHFNIDEIYSFCCNPAGPTKWNIAFHGQLHKNAINGEIQDGGVNTKIVLKKIEPRWDVAEIWDNIDVLIQTIDCVRLKK